MKRAIFLLIVLAGCNAGGAMGAYYQCDDCPGLIITVVDSADGEVLPDASVYDGD
jgi:hypothetical protein